jgi:type II secretory pathway pseudopilin PulG
MAAQRGFTYLGVLLAIALLGVGMIAASELWVTTARRQRMEQLEWVGQQYVQAIGSYYENSPGRAKAYPKALDDLLEDRRFVFARRHLRQLYVNPFSGAADWELVLAPGGGIRGVRIAVQEAWSFKSAYEFSHTPLTQ